MRIGLYPFEGAEELDSAGPWEVLAAWAQLWPSALSANRQRAAPNKARLVASLLSAYLY